MVVVAWNTSCMQKTNRETRENPTAQCTVSKGAARSAKQ